ncbi:NUC189-domain-containing protein [Hesseltinella vesiculosa]|uniref:NUC189-domain-containing protein n=1 Tax=Hesseltinella vesiculosa TaxID=101127 RepID=A0A1X2G9M5_9FUNG|nr:NUC189-domain-containing protein [Hesseltinella vesiculosa]
MGKKTFAPNPETSSVITSINTASGILLSGFDNSAAGEYFALVSHGLDRHRLRIFNVRSGTVNNDYTSEGNERFTCLSWGNIKDNGGFGQLDDGKARKRKTGSTMTKVVILGTQTGSILMYSLAHGEIVKRLENVHTMPVLDFVMNKAGTKGYSIAEDNTIVEWDIEEGRDIMKLKADAKHMQRLRLGHNEKKLAAAGHTISLWDLAERKVIKLVFSPQDDLLVSIAEDDRYVNVWDAQSSNTNTNNLTVLTLEDNATHLHFSISEPSVLAVSEDGTCGVWQNASGAPSSSRSGHPPKKIMRGAITRSPDTTILVTASQDEQTRIPILNARFVSDFGGQAVMIARGSSIKPIFEVVPYIQEDGAVKESIHLSRQLVTNYLVSGNASERVAKINKAYDETHSNVVGNTDYTMQQAHMADSDDDEYDVVVPSSNQQEEMTIEQRLAAMEMAQEGGVDDDDDDEADKGTMKKNGSTAPSSPSGVPSMPAQSLQNVLVQALHSNDRVLLEGCLMQRHPETIATTVRRLPTPYVIPLLVKLIERFQEKPSRGQAMMDWIQPVLQFHTAYLMTVPDLMTKLANFYQAIDTRVQVLPKLQKLQGRLDIVEAQIETRASTNNLMQQQSTLKPASTYLELSDDEEDNDDMDDGLMDEDVSMDEDSEDQGFDSDEDDDMIELDSHDE